ncbi:putative disease resistance protein RGA3 isoform X2 [Benincasa hispida]|nr:putative disease resistance protein RGA3 isoform X2 [Benincasa hispida]
MALEGVLSSVGGEILNLLGSQALQRLGMLREFDDDLDKLKTNVSAIKAVLCDAQERELKGEHSLTDWLEKLGQAFYDAEDVLDEVATESRRREVMTRGKNAKQVRIFFSNSNQLAFNYRMTRQLKKINERLDVISQEKDKFRLNINVEPMMSSALSHPFGKRRETESSLEEVKVIGRDDDMSYIKNLLLAEDDMNVKANVSFIAIVGMGGIGKTTLARALYDDKEVKDCFNPRIWIWVSNQFDRSTILKKIIESATEKKAEVEGLEALKKKLQKVIEGNKYLLVMDDVWSENKNEWENLKSLLMVGARGSKILITKRDSHKVVPDIEIVSLKDLPEDHSWRLFKQVAFKESELESIDPNLVRLGKEISKKCGGIPLVISHIGSLLYGTTSTEAWMLIKDNELLNVTQEQNNNGRNVISTLKLSYNYLPPNLKQCFAYTSLFPKGYKINSNELIRQWMAQGFIKSSNRGKSMEDIGKDYINELRRRFFYESSIHDENGTSDDIVSMHDVMRDLAREVAGKKLLYVYGDGSDEYVVGKHTRHISFNYEVCVDEENVLSKLREAKGLRTFLLLFYPYGPVPLAEKSFLDKLFFMFPRLRVLQIRNVSKSIKRLKHLRYLNFTVSSGVESVPNSITELQNLQTLNLAGCYRLKKLPRDLSNLVNLRHLLFNPFKLIHTPEEIENLSYLQTLSSFVLDCKNLNKLREFNKLNYYMEDGLRIIGLEMLRSTPFEVNSVNLKDRRDYRRLKLEWKLGNDECEAVESDETILEGLEPHPNVEVLSIKGYCGVELPNWVSTSLSLTMIDIKNCPRLQHVHQFGYLRALKILSLINLGSLISLSEWIGSTTSLRALKIVKCPELKSLPMEMRQLEFLESLRIWDCPQLKERCKKGGEDWPNISHVTMVSYEENWPHTSYITFSSYKEPPYFSDDDEDDENEEKRKMKACITNIGSFFCG